MAVEIASGERLIRPRRQGQLSDGVPAGERPRSRLESVEVGSLARRLRLLSRSEEPQLVAKDRPPERGLRLLRLVGLGSLVERQLGRSGRTSVVRRRAGNETLSRAEEVRIVVAVIRGT